VRGHDRKPIYQLLNLRRGETKELIGLTIAPCGTLDLELVSG
jgi:hypothetical protein